jgi:arylsulfatase A
MKSKMSRRDVIKGMGVAGVVGWGLPHRLLNGGLKPTLPAAGKSRVQGMAAAGEAKKKPNVIFILIDDMGWADLTCYGSKFHETPNIDRLAKNGIRFTDAYAAGAVCSPTRASILAGQYPARVGITDFIPGHYRPWTKLRVPENRLQLPLESVTFGEVLRRHGYATGYIGKWHLGGRDHGPEQQGFESIPAGGRNQGDKHVTRFTDAAIEFIEANRNKPFLLFLSHHTVHIPLEAPAELIEKYENKPKPAQGVNNPVYAAMVEHLDDSIGRIMKELDQLGLTERTVVIFFSDNGGLRQRFDGKGEIVTTNAPLRDEKGTLYEGGIRVPLIVRWPGVVKSGVCRVPVCSTDFYPTLLELAGARGNPNHVLDGKSIVPLLMGTHRFEREALFWHYPHYHHSTPAGAMRQGDWKLLEFFEGGRVELYNLKNDIGEKDDLAKKMPAKAAELRQRLAAWRKSVRAKMPTPNPDYDPDRAHEWGRRPRKKPAE